MKNWFIYQLSSWIIFISSIDRYIATKYPTKYLFRKKFKYQLLIILIAFISITLINIPYYYFVTIVNINTNVTACQLKDITILGYVDLSDALNATIIPFFMMVLFNSLTFKELLRRKKTSQKKKFDKEYRFFKVLLFMNLFFLSCNLPICFYTETYDALGIQYVHMLGFILVNYLTFLYYSLNFFVYFSSNKLFRDYALSILFFFRKNTKNGVLKSKNVSTPAE